MKFAEIIRRLGERGELGESPHYQRDYAGANAGRTGANSVGEKANHPGEGEDSPAFARNSPFHEPAGMAAISPIRPIRPEPEENENLSDDFKLVAAWWEWTQDDTNDFKNWARQNQDDAAQWIHAEAITCRQTTKGKND